MKKRPLIDTAFDRSPAVIPPPRFPIKPSMRAGFTLIEMSIVLVIIGLVVGGVLVGQDLIRAAYVRAQISQIEKFNTAVNTFYGKYGALPGDLNAQVAETNGFAARGTVPFSGVICGGQGDGNGLLQSCNVYNGGGVGSWFGTFEQEYFWSDLSYANGLNINLIEGSFKPGSALNVKALSKVFPGAKIEAGNFVLAWSGGWMDWYGGISGASDGKNYFTVGAVRNILPGSHPTMDMGLTVREAYDIDRKIDDGFPQLGRVTALFPGTNYDWASAQASDSVANATGGLSGLADGTTGAGPVTDPNNVVGDTNDSTTCYDFANPSSPSLPLVYSVATNANTINCALSFQMQGGD